MRARARNLAAAAVALAISATLLIWYHDHSWWGPDDGNYAHVAERVLDGDVLNRDVQDVHAGYINFVNAAALAVFGRRIVSLRYPLIVVGIVQSLLVFMLLLDRGRWAAASGAVAMSALGMIQFFNPTPHWYSLFLTVVLAGWLRWMPQERRGRLEGAGFIVMLVFLFRQLSGVLLAIGLLCFLLLERQSSPPPGSRTLGRTLAVTMIGGLVWYLVTATTVGGWLIYGAWPVGLLLLALSRMQVTDSVLLRVIGRMSIGGLAAIAPLLWYHVYHGSITTWFDDTVVAAVALPRLPFIEYFSPGLWTVGAAVTIASGAPGLVLPAIFWIVAPLLPALTGFMVLRHMSRHRSRALTGVDALPVLAVFYAVVSVHYAIHIYQFYTLPLSAVALLATTRWWGSRGLAVTAALIVALSAHAIAFNAGQPVARFPQQIVEGHRRSLVALPFLPRAGILVAPEDARLYASLVQRIRRDVSASHSIAAIPSNAELYFLAERRNPFRFFNTALGIRDSSGFLNALRALERDPPALVFHNATDKYNTAWSDSLMTVLRASYEPVATEGSIHVYRSREHVNAR